MKSLIDEGWNSLLRLLRFLLWYGTAVAVVLYVLPMAGAFLESQYESLSSSARFIAVIGFFAVVAAWQVIGRRDRLRRTPRRGSGH
jgi:hypothetical protein